MATKQEELNKFQEYFSKEELIFGINMDSNNAIESSVVWYQYEKNQMVVYHLLNPQTNIVLKYNQISLNIPLNKFLSQMKEWEHDFCMSAMEENYQADLECYNYFDYVTDQWKRKVELYKLELKK